MTLTLPTEQEAEAIRSGDKELKDRYYLANRENIERLARSYCRKVPNYKEWEDLAHEAYLHFDSIDFRKPSYFTHSLYRCFWEYRIGGRYKYTQLYDYKTRKRTELDILSLDSQVKGADDVCVGDLIPSGFDIYDELEPRPDIVDCFDSVISKYLTENQSKVMRLYLVGSSYLQITQSTGVCGVKSAINAASKRIFTHLQEIVFALRCRDIELRVPNVPGFVFESYADVQRKRNAGKPKPPKKPLTEEQLERIRAYKRKYRQTHLEQVRAANRERERRKREERKAAANITA